MANDVNATGIVGMNGLPFASTRLPLSTPVRPGLPSLKMTTPDRAGGLRVLHLHAEVAAAALDQRDLARRRSR